MNDAKQQLLEKLKGANNILVTVSHDPSVDQLSACLALTLALNKLGKHATAVFSGQVPSNLEFLQPDLTLEKNTDSLRDFIIALDKSKADKLRYKVENDVVRIFITPYKTSISDADLEFSQGDFNVDVVVALGVQRQEDLDAAIVAHGRILHDATVTSINLTTDQGLGSINWQDPQASSLGELTTELVQELGPQLLDNQIATALLTGIVAETERFSNEKTSPQTMSLSAALMSAGADQQLVASKLNEPALTPEATEPEAQEPADQQSDNWPDQPTTEPPKQDGTLEINHQAPAETPDQSQEPKEPKEPQFELPEPAVDPEPQPEPQPELPPPDMPEPSNDHLSEGSKLITEPPSLGGRLTANTEPEALDPSTDPLGATEHGDEQLLSHDSPVDATPDPAPAPAPTPSPEPFIAGLTPPPPAWVPPSEDPFNLAPESSAPTLAELEANVDSPHLEPSPAAPETVDTARDEVLKALNQAPPATPAPIEALNAQPFGGELHPTSNVLPSDQPPADPLTANPSHEFSDVMQDQIPTLPTPPSMPMPDPQAAPIQPAPQVFDPTAAPPVPPPIPFQFGNPPQQ